MRLGLEVNNIFPDTKRRPKALLLAFNLIKKHRERQKVLNSTCAAKYSSIWLIGLEIGLVEIDTVGGGQKEEHYRQLPEDNFSSPSHTERDSLIKAEMTTCGKNEYQKLHEACEAGNITSLRSLLGDTAFTECALQRPVKQYNNITQPILNLVDLLKVATAQGHYPIVGLLVAFGQEHNVSHVELINRDTVVAAIDGRNGLEVFRIFVETWPEVIELDMGHLGNPLAYAVVKDQIQLTKFLLDEGADPNRRCLAHAGSGHYLRQSVKSSSSEIIKTLLQHGARIQFSGAIQEAAKLGRVDVLELLLNSGADVNETLPADVGFLIRDKRYQQASESPLHVAALHAQICSIRWLLAHGADPNIADAQGRTPVMIAQASTNDGLAEAFAV